MPEPPAPTTATAANWEAPVKTNRDMAHVWARVSPAVVASTPKVIPKTPTPMLMASASRR